jgi:hypothetical protein
VESVFDTMQGFPDEFWFVMCHAQGNEQMTVAATMHQHYDFIDLHMGRDAAAVLLRAQRR